MNPDQLKLSRILKKIQNEQPSDSQFWNNDGGTHIFELAKWANFTEPEALTLSNELQSSGKAVVTIRADGKEGLKLLQPAIDEVNAIEVAENIAVQAQAAIDTQIARDNEITGIITRAKQLSLTEAFPVDSIFISISPINPAISLGYGTWVSFGSGRVLVGVDTGDSDFSLSERIGGSKTHALTVNEIPSHRHQILRERSATTGTQNTQIARTADITSTIDTNVFTENTGGGLAHNNVQPYICVYMFKRTI